MHTLVGYSEGFFIGLESSGSNKVRLMRIPENETAPAVSKLKNVFSFPNPVNEVAARMVAGMVIALSLAIIFTDQSWLMFVLAYGFLARVATGPTLSPMGLLATRVLVPIVGNPQRPVPGPPSGSHNQSA